MRLLNSVNLLIVLVLVMTASVALNLQGTIDTLDWFYDSGRWLLRLAATSL